MDRKEVTALTLLDLSAAFDTIDHHTLFETLTDWFNIQGSALSWLKSYLTNRHQLIKLGKISSNPSTLPYGVPQGSVLGPLLFTMYTTPLSHVINTHNISHHLYADDTQIYVSLNAENGIQALNSLSDCLVDIKLWMHHTKLKLNPDKTEFILIGSKFQRDKFKDLFPVQLLGNAVVPSINVKNLGVTFDADHSFIKQVSNIYRSCFYHMRDLRRIRRYLTHDAAISLANALVGSRLDYCNSLLYGMPKKYIDRLQKVQNCLCRIITRARPFSPVSHKLKEIHWLPVQFRILFKLNVLTFKALNLSEPGYLRSLISPSPRTRGCRLSVPKSSSNNKAGSKAFVIAAPTEWNKLPPEIRTISSLPIFRQKLKTYLFTKAFPP